MGGPWWPCIYFAPLWRYGASNVGCTHVDTERKMEEGKKKEEVGGEEKGKRKKELKGEGEGKEEGKGESGKGREKGEVKGEGERRRERENGEGKEGEWKGRGRLKEDSLRKVGHTDTQVILYSVQCYSLHWSDSYCSSCTQATWQEVYKWQREKDKHLWFTCNVWCCRNVFWFDFFS